jgi:hypothetical protein
MFEALEVTLEDVCYYDIKHARQLLHAAIQYSIPSR